MEQFVGLDVSQEMTNVCAVDRNGTVIWRGTCLSTPENIAAVVREKAPSAVRIGLETGALATWHWPQGSPHFWLRAKSDTANYAWQAQLRCFPL